MFSDSDLKRLKEAIANRPHSSSDCVSVCSQVEKGLFSRLEAAETFCWRAVENEPQLEETKEYKAWLKSKGE